MKMSHISLVAVILCGVLLIPQLAAAQVKDPAEIDSFISPGGGVAIPDDGYDGTLGSMACQSTSAPAGNVTAVDVDLGVDHSWVGDLTVKVVSPDSSVLTVLARPGLAGGPDDGTGCCGNNADIINTSPINFDDANPTDAETMGSAGSFVCQDDGECTFFPNPDGAPGTDFSQFLGASTGGDWQVCVGDSAAGDAGFLIASTVNVTVTVPTTNRVGLLLLLGLLAGGSLLVMRRKATIG